MINIAKIYPYPFPHNLKKRPRLIGEKLVYDSLIKVLDSTWIVFYDWTVKGTRRRIDFLCVSRKYGIVAFEVKGSLVHYHRGKFLQLNRKTKRRKAINPFYQLKRGYNEVVKACKIDFDSLPMAHLAVFFPEMRQGGFQFKDGLHIFTEENLQLGSFNRKLSGAVKTPSVAEVRIIKSFIYCLERHGIKN